MNIEILIESLSDESPALNSNPNCVAWISSWGLIYSQCIDGNDSKPCNIIVAINFEAKYWEKLIHCRVPYLRFPSFLTYPKNYILCGGIAATT